MNPQRLRLTAIRTLQNDLDERIMAIHHVTRDQTRAKRVLALVVEIGELANETRCFKYWSLKGPSEKETLLEELSDTVHFIVSLGIDLGDTAETMDFIERHEDLSAQFCDWVSAVLALREHYDLDHYRHALSYIGSVALALGFSADDVYDFYVRKNEINHTRQSNRY
jgi:dimeric dUTPase (all-alpha-NTP-PPase superfamily)